MMSLLRKIIPKPILLFYHRISAVLAAFFYGYPSKKLIVIGVTGTTGKTTTCNLIYRILHKSGQKCAMSTTANFAIGDKEWISKYKQTMLGCFKLQKFLKRVVKAGCKYCVMEVTSQGVEQSRHIGINFDCGVFTNLFPEHIEAHGGFENYKKAKLDFFKIVKNKIVVNADDKYALEFLDFLVKKKVTFCIEKESCISKAVNVNVSDNSLEFSIQKDDVDFHLNMLGRYNVYNALAAISTCSLYKIEMEKMSEILEDLQMKLGRMEMIDEGQDFKIIVDYAFEPVALKNAYRAAKKLIKNSGKLISVLGSCGGGRDVVRRPKLGRLAGKCADIVIVTNEDPYDDDPQMIIDQVVKGVLENGGELDSNLFKILDRRKAINLALKKARLGDVVLITGKGCEQMIMTGPVGSGKGIEWDDRRVVREELMKLKNKV